MHVDRPVPAIARSDRRAFSHATSAPLWGALDLPRPSEQAQARPAASRASRPDTRYDKGALSVRAVEVPFALLAERLLELAGRAGG